MKISAETHNDGEDSDEMLDEQFDEQLIRYWLHEGSADERRRLERWFGDQPKQYEQFQRLYREIERGDWIAQPPELIAERKSEILQHIQESAGSHRRTWRSATTSWMRPMIATFTLAVVSAAAIWQYRASDSAPSFIQHSTYTTGNSERAQITLPDGTIIQLNVASRLEVPSNYGPKNRTVRLNGEALFTVIHQSGTPFTVTAGSTITRVLGTSFVVRRYLTDTAALIAVRDGKVSVGATVLTAGNEMTDGRNGPSSVRTASAARFSFSEGILVLDSLPLQHAIPELNRWYNADIRLSDSTLARRLVVGTFEAGSISDLIWILRQTYDVHIVQQGRTLTLYPRG